MQYYELLDRLTASKLILVAFGIVRERRQADVR